MWLGLFLKGDVNINNAALSLILWGVEIVLVTTAGMNFLSNSTQR